MIMTTQTRVGKLLEKLSTLDEAKRIGEFTIMAKGFTRKQITLDLTRLHYAVNMSKMDTEEDAMRKAKRFLELWLPLELKGIARLADSERTTYMIRLISIQERAEEMNDHDTKKMLNLLREIMKMYGF
jgi:hypothetical protein